MAPKGKTISHEGTRLPALGRWCDRHSRWECTKQRSRGRGQCHGAAIKGTDACVQHSGKSVAQARKDAITAWAAVAGDDGITPRAAVSAHLGLSWRRAQEYGRLLAEQVGDSRQAPGMDAATPDGDGAAGTAGLVGHTYSSGGPDIGIYATGEKTRGLVDLEMRERELLLKFAAAGHTMGIEERAQWQAERDAAGIHAVMKLTAEKLGMDTSDPAVGAAVAAAIRELSGAPRAIGPG